MSFCARFGLQYNHIHNAKPSFSSLTYFDILKEELSTVARGYKYWPQNSSRGKGSRCLLIGTSMLFKYMKARVTSLPVNYWMELNLHHKRLVCWMSYFQPRFPDQGYWKYLILDVHSSLTASCQSEMQLCLHRASSKDYSLDAPSRCAKPMWPKWKLCAKLSHWLNLNSGTQPNWGIGHREIIGHTVWISHPWGFVCTHQYHRTKICVWIQNGTLCS